MTADGRSGGQWEANEVRVGPYYRGFNDYIRSCSHTFKYYDELHNYYLHLLEKDVQIDKFPISMKGCRIQSVFCIGKAAAVLKQPMKPWKTKAPSLIP